MTDLIVKEVNKSLEFWDPYDDEAPVHVMEWLPESYEELCDLLGQLGSDVDFRPDPG